MTQKEVQKRLREFMVLLQPDVKRRLETSNESTMADDLDALDLMIKYFVFDREASIREAMKFGGNDEQQKH